MVRIAWATPSADVGRQMFCEAMRDARRTAIIEAQRFMSPHRGYTARVVERYAVINPMETDPA